MIAKRRWKPRLGTARLPAASAWYPEGHILEEATTLLGKHLAQGIALSPLDRVQSSPPPHTIPIDWTT
jgi:hypothetical protein